MRYTMNTRCLLYASLLLLTMGCGQKSDSTAKEMDGDLSARIDSIGHVFTDSASMLRIMVMDSSGRLVANSIVGNEGSATPNDKIAITPGDLIFPVLLASLDEAIDTSTLMLRIGDKDYDGCRIADSHVPIDPYTGLPCDSLPVMQAMKIHSPVAMTELGWAFYHDKRELLKERLCAMLPGVEFTSYNPESTGFGNDSDFRNYCRGYGMKVPMTSLLKCYLRSDVSSLLNGGRMIGWESTVVDGKESDICIGYSADGRYAALIIVSRNPMSSAVFEQLFRK